MRKRVYIAYTGGTIGMKSTGDGYVPATGYLEKLMNTRNSKAISCPITKFANMNPCWTLQI
jgi:L-asparaginase/Glu-tRNA(Gln) amidotransferase subunit D